MLNSRISGPINRAMSYLEAELFYESSQHFKTLSVELKAERKNMRRYPHLENTLERIILKVDYTQEELEILSLLKSPEIKYSVDSGLEKAIERRYVSEIRGRVKLTPLGWDKIFEIPSQMKLFFNIEEARIFSRDYLDSERKDLDTPTIPIKEATVSEKLKSILADLEDIKMRVTHLETLLFARDVFGDLMVVEQFNNNEYKERFRYLESEFGKDHPEIKRFLVEARRAVAAEKEIKELRQKKKILHQKFDDIAGERIFTK